MQVIVRFDGSKQLFGLLLQWLGEVSVPLLMDSGSQGFKQCS